MQGDTFGEYTNTTQFTTLPRTGNRVQRYTDTSSARVSHAEAPRSQMGSPRGGGGAPTPLVQFFHTPKRTVCTSEPSDHLV
ncbi:hypothetical protein O3P69_006116 [Scylla paramamosain]|uniref:Uncharacterized protein n=1 Tax=Scylla paramamosain TaxID=85552 RepID=A0AAW0SHK7_SCYPA